MKGLENYETVKSRKNRFYSDNKDGRIVVTLMNQETTNHVLMMAHVFKNGDDQTKGLAWSTGYAQEFKGQGGFANKTSWLENCEESAVGRALDNAGYCGNGSCSQEEIVQAQRNGRSLANNHQGGKDFETDPGAFRMPFGKLKGSPLREIDTDTLKESVMWMQQTDANKFKDLITKINLYLMDSGNA